jgi:hypothetical protein
VDGYPRPAAPASRFRWPAVAADPVQRPCARAVSIAHTETPSEIVETVKWGRRRGDNHQLSPRSDSGVGSSGLGEGVVRMLRDRAERFDAFLTPPSTAVPGQNKSRSDQRKKD